MANEEHLKILKSGLQEWNKWRRLEENFAVRPDLSGLDLRGAELLAGYFREVNFSNVDFRGANLREANLSGANLQNANFAGANLCQAKLMATNCNECDFSRADISASNFSNAKVIKAKLVGANLVEANLNQAKFNNSDLSQALLIDAKLTKTDFTNAKLVSAKLGGSLLLGTILNHADISKCHVYGISAWDLELDKTIQNNLVVTKIGDAEVSVNDIEIAQFIYFMIENKKIRRVLDAMTSKVILILGRFTKERKVILDALRNKLSTMDLLPIIFDFDKPIDRDYTETVLTLACLSRFVIIDLTDPSSSPHEARGIIPDLQIPFLPIVQKGQKEYSLFSNLFKYPWVFKTKNGKPIFYEDCDHLIGNIEKLINKANEIYLEIQDKKEQQYAAPTEEDSIENI